MDFLLQQCNKNNKITALYLQDIHFRLSFSLVLSLSLSLPLSLSLSLSLLPLTDSYTLSLPFFSVFLSLTLFPSLSFSLFLSFSPPLPLSFSLSLSLPP